MIPLAMPFFATQTRRCLVTRALIAQLAKPMWSTTKSTATVATMLRVEIPVALLQFAARMNSSSSTRVQFVQLEQPMMLEMTLQVATPVALLRNVAQIS
jgi:hypothetical protein